MHESNHILTTFNESLGSLRDDVLMMASLAERSLEHALRGLRERNHDLCGSVIADDEEIDLLEKQIDKLGMEIMMRFQPVASDLRSVIAAMRLSNNLERIADLAVSIARRARKMNGSAVLEELMLLDPMIDKVLSMLKDSIRAFADGNTDLAMEIKGRDREIDKLNNQIAEHLTDLMVKESHKVQGLLGLILIARSLERVGDHATNIAEDAVFSISATDIRHTSHAVVN